MVDLCGQSGRDITGVTQQVTQPVDAGYCIR